MTNRPPQLKVLSEEQKAELYKTALTILSRVGVNVYNPEGRQLLAEAGASVDGKRVLIPAAIIENALKTAPRSFKLWDRNGQSYLDVAPNTVYFGSGPTCTYFSDPVTGERRPARRGDAGLTAKVCDALPNLDFIMSLGLYSDVTPVLSPVYEFADMIVNSTKPIAAWANDDATLRAVYEIAKVVAGGADNLRQKPSFVHFATYQSPLQHKDESVGTMLWAAEHDIPVALLGGPTVGLESPITSAGGLVLFLAAALSGLAMIQLKKPGAPIAIGGVPAAMDLRTVRPSYGSPEMSLNTAACSELTRYLNLPFMGTAGATESKRIDAQTGAEVMSQIIFSALSGAGLVHDVGFLDCADIGSLELLILANEIIDYVKRMMRGIEVSPETIMLDLIEKIGPGGQFLAERETASLCRQEIWMPKVFDRNPYAAWQEMGGKSTAEITQEKLQDILSQHHPPELAQSALNQIEMILKSEEDRVQRVEIERFPPG